MHHALDIYQGFWRIGWLFYASFFELRQLFGFCFIIKLDVEDCWRGMDVWGRVDVG